MSEQQNANEINAQEVITQLSLEVAESTRRRVIAEVQAKRLVDLLTQSQEVIKGLQEEISRLTALANAPKGRDKPRTSKPAGEVVPGEFEEVPDVAAE